MGTLITARLISPDDKAVQKLDDFLSDRIDAYETLLRCTVRGRFTR